MIFKVSGKAALCVLQDAHGDISSYVTDDSSENICIGSNAQCTATSSYQLSIGDTAFGSQAVNSSTNNAVTNKLSVIVGGTQYYFLMSTSNA